MFIDGVFHVHSLALKRLTAPALNHRGGSEQTLVLRLSEVIRWSTSLGCAFEPSPLTCECPPHGRCSGARMPGMTGHFPAGGQKDCLALDWTGASFGTRI